MSESVQSVIIAPTLMLAVLMVIYSAIWFHARTTVQQAALTGAEVASMVGATTGTGEAAAGQLTSGLDDVHIAVSSDGQLVQVVVSGRARMPLDIGLGMVTATATRPLEK